MTELFYFVSAVLAAVTFPFVVDSWKRFSTSHMKKLAEGLGFVYICGFVYSLVPFFVSDMALRDLVGRVCVSLFFVGVIYLNYTLNRMSRLFGFKETGGKISKKHP